MQEALPTNEVQRGEPQGTHGVPSQAETRPPFASGEESDAATLSALPRNVSKQLRIDPETGCWLWTGYLTPRGYAAGTVAMKKGVRMHRVTYAQLRGPIPDGLQLDHLCRVRHCINPWHLEAVTCRENLMRGDTIAAANASKTHCKRGHEFTPENTYRPPAGGRICRACRVSA